MKELSVYQVPEVIERNFSRPISQELKELPLPAQKDFLRIYGQEIRVLGIAYLLHLFFGAAYLYKGEWLKQILFWLTGFGFGIGYVVNFFRMPWLIRKANQRIAYKIIDNLKMHYGIAEGKSNRKAPYQSSIKMPRNIRPNYDPAHLSLENLQEGFLVDYDLKTWEVVSENQFDWASGESERELTLVADGEKVSLMLRKINGYSEILSMKQINAFALGREFMDNVQSPQRPPNDTLYFEGKTFYREREKEGDFFQIGRQPGAVGVRQWEYWDTERAQVLLLEFNEKQNYRAFYGKPVYEFAFSDILPKNIA